MGPYANANTVIGRAWNLLSINGGNSGKVGTTYMGMVGNPMNAINIIIAENEEDSPWEPLCVRRGKGNTQREGVYITPPGGTFTVIVTGASNNNYFSMGGLVPAMSIRIDPWR